MQLQRACCYRAHCLACGLSALAKQPAAADIGWSFYINRWRYFEFLDNESLSLSFLFVSLLLAKGNEIQGCQIFKRDIQQNLKFLDILPTRLQSKMVGDSKLVGDLNWKLGTLNFKAFKIGGRVEGVLQARYPSLFIKICSVAIEYFQWKIRL